MTDIYTSSNGIIGLPARQEQGCPGSIYSSLLKAEKVSLFRFIGNQLPFFLNLLSAELKIVN
jgi:hypothetical protein